MCKFHSVRILNQSDIEFIIGRSLDRDIDNHIIDHVERMFRPNSIDVRIKSDAFVVRVYGREMSHSYVF